MKNNQASKFLQCGPAEYVSRARAKTNEALKANI